jgi:hypothetical protein
MAPKIQPNRSLNEKLVYPSATTEGGWRGANQLASDPIEKARAGKEVKVRE